MTIWSYIWMPIVGVGLTILSYMFYKHREKKDEYTFSFLCVVVAGFLLALSVTFLTVAQFGGTYDNRQCDRYEIATGVETTFYRFSFWTWDCYVTTDKGRITLDQYKAIETVNRTEHE